jgi:single-strand DNA-binding protein
MGRLTRDPELRYTQSGVSVCSFSLAVDRNFVRQGEQRQADFINCTAWRQTGEFINKYFTKGRLIAVSGSLQTRSWDAQDGTKRYATDVIVDEASFCGDGRRDGDGAQYQQNGQYQSGSQYRPQANTAEQNNIGPSEGAYKPATQSGGDFAQGYSDDAGAGYIPVDSDDDLPF